MKKPIRVLLVEDSEDDAILIVHELRRGGAEATFERVDTPEAMQAALSRESWDVVVADYSMPRFSGLAALELLHEQGMDLPFILVSGTIGEEIAVEAMKAGAHDYLMKDNLTRLAPAIERELQEAWERHARRQAEAALHRRAEELAALHAASLRITEPHELSELIHVIIEQAKYLLKAPWGGLSLCDPNREDIHVFEERINDEHDYTGLVFKYGEGAAGVVARTGEALVIDDYRTWPHRAAIYEQDKPYIAVISMPLIWHGQVTGVLQVMDDSESRRFTKEEMELLGLFADQVAIAIENARLLEAERASREQAETLREVAQVLNTTLELEVMLRLILDQLKRVLTFETASVFLVEEGGKPTLMTGVGFSDEELTSQAAIELLADSPILAQMARERKPVVIKDVHEHPGWVVIPGSEHVRSFLGVPVVVQEKMVGVLTVDSSSVAFFGDDDVHVVSSLAQHISLAIQNVRLFEAEHIQRERAEILSEAARVISATLSLDAMLVAVLEQLRRLLPFDSGCVMLVEERQVVVKGWRGFGAYADLQMPETVRFDLDADRVAALVLRQGNPVVVTDVQNDPRWEVIEVSRYVQSWMGIPLQVRDQVFGLLSLERSSPEGFSVEEISLAETFAAHVAAAIDNARLFEEVEQRAAELLAVRQATLGLTASLEPGAVLDAILKSTLSFLPEARNAHIFLYHEAEGGGRLTFGAALWADGRRGEPLAYPRPHGLTHTVARSGQEIVVPDMRDHPLYADIPAERDWSGGIVGLPLKIGRRVVGVMNVSYSQPHDFSEAELRVLSLLGDQAAIAIENARLFESAEAERRHLGLLYALGRELATSLDYNEILARAIALTCQSLGGYVGEAFLYIPEEDRLSLRGLHGQVVGDIAALDERLNLVSGKGLAGWVAQQRTPVNVPDVTQEPRWFHVPGVDDEARSVLCAPIMESGRLLGVLSVLHRQSGAFTANHLDLLQAICQQVALALSNAGRYQQVQDLVGLLEDEQRRLESLVERLPVGVLLLDAEYHLLVANFLGRQILAKLGSAGSGEVLTHLGFYSLPDLCESISTLEIEEPPPVEIVLDGPPRTIIEAQVRPIGGETRQWVLTLRDITQERESQERIRLQERLATVGQLAAGIAHDFNNIMAAITVYTDLLLGDDRLPATSRERLTIIQQQVQRAASLIRQILDFSRRSVMEQSQLDLLPFIKELDKLLSRVLPETIRLELAYQPGSYLVNVDPTRLQQVFMNLALNARDAMPEGGSLIFELSRARVRKRERPPHPDLTPGEWICLKVSDTGAGIAPDVLPHVFDPFFTTKAVGEGTGLGLAQVYGIIRQHDGQIDVSSQPGEGAQFSIYLPALPELLEEEIAQEPVKLLEGTGMTALVVEDDAVTREALKALLETHNFRVMAAPNGVEALQIFELYGDAISLVVVDMVMPEMGGVALYENLRERWPKVKTLFVTGHPLEARDQELLEKGGVHWLQKPFSVQEFNSAVRAMLES